MAEREAFGELGDRGRKGAKVILLGQGMRLFANLGGTVLLSRLLAPEDFGLMALVLSVAALGELLRDFGLTTAAARSTSITQDQKTNLLWANTALGFLLFTTVFLLSTPISMIFGEPRLAEMVMLISPIFLFSGISAQFRSEINRKLEFGRLAAVESAPPILGLSIAVAWALFSPSETALVVQQLATHLLGLILAVALARWRPGLVNRRGDIRPFARFGIGLFGTQITAYSARNGDNFLLGLFSDAASLGLYSRAFQILMLPISQLQAPLTRVAVPILTRVANDSAALSGFLRSITRINVLLLGCGFAFAFALAPELISLIFGSQWSAMTPIFQALCIGGIFKALNQSTFWAFLATDNTGPQFWLNLWSQPLIVVAMAAGVPWGAFGVAVGHSVGYGIYWLVAGIRCAKVCGFSFVPQLREILRGVFIMVLPVGLIAFSCSFLPSDLLSVLAGVTGTVGWLALLARFDTRVRSTVTTILRRG